MKLKKRDVIEAEKSIDYLSLQLNKSAITDLKTVFFELIEQQMKVIMFAEVREEYAFKTIDPAVLPELKSGPKRSLIVIISTIAGVFLSLFFLVCFFLIRLLIL